MYYLMNRDTIVGNFSLSDLVLHSRGSSYTPIMYSGFQAWLKSRYKFSCVDKVDKFFSDIGIKNLEDFIDVFHCISLSDTFWVKRCIDNITWSSVSPYSNSYSKVVSHYALDGILLSGNNYLSPDISTGGSYPHTWKWYNNKVYFIKAGSKYTLGGSNSGREPYSEFFVYKLGEYLGFNMLEYDLRNHRRADGKIDIVTSSLCYNSEDIGSVSAYALGLTSYDSIIKFSKKLGKDSLKTVLDMLFLDCLCLNVDRHFGNIEFSVDNNSGRILYARPIFDNNNALLPRFMEGYDTFNRDEYIASTGQTFDELYDIISKYYSYKSCLRSVLKYKIVSPKIGGVTSRRLKFLNKFLHSSAKYLLRYS